MQFPYPIPTPYKCPTEESCNVGLDSKCANGYEGPLRAICSSGYYEQLKTCKYCPPKMWMVGQLFIIAAIALMTTLVLAWASKSQTNKVEGRSLIDSFFSKLKIVIGFYQITRGILHAFSFIQWPDSMEIVARYSEIIQLNVFSTLCFGRNSLHSTYLYRLVNMTVTNRIKDNQVE